MPLTTDPQTPPQAQEWQLKRYSWMSILAPFALFLTLICAVELSAQQQALRDQSLQQEHLKDKANQIRTLLEYELNSTLHIATGLVSYIQSKQGKIIAAEIDPWLVNLQGRAHYLRNIAIAPNNKITLVYPLAGNEAALGLNYPDNKEQWPTIQKIILSKQPILAGPIHLQQGGLGLIHRTPIFLSNNEYWGLVSTVLNFDKIYSMIHARAEQLGIKIAIKDLDNGGTILFGDADVINNSELTVSVPGRNWQLISSLQAPIALTGLSTMRFSGWVISAAIALLFNLFLRSLAQKNKTLHALNESQYRFSQAFNSAPQGMALISYKGVLLDFNESLCATLGYTRSELNSHNFFAIVAPNQRERLSNIIEGIYPKPGANHQYESELLHKSQQHINVILSMAATHANTYESNWIVQIIDISHRITFEQLLQEGTSYNQSILDAIVDGIMIIDATGNVRSANPAASNIFGYELDQFLHQHINQFVQDPETGSIMRHIKYHSEKRDINTEINHEIIGFKMDGQAFSLELQLSCINRKKEKLFIAVVRDISDRKHLDNLKHEFISRISQEFRTPLSSITSSLRLMESGAFGTFSEPAHNIIRSADQSAQKLSLLVDDLLDIDKLLSGKMQFDVKTQAIYPLVSEAIEKISEYAAQHDVTFELLSQDEQLSVNVDSQRLQQVLTNLMSNAAKFSPAQARVKINIINLNDKVHIEVIDQGIGIPAAAHPKLFQKFYQVDSSNARKTSGTGLGLAIAKELVSAMKGTIGVTSEIGKGSCFFVELPLIQTSEAQIKSTEY